MPAAGDGPGPVTRALDASGDDTRAALEAVLPLVYAELREIAARTLASGARLTVQPTDLVHEAFLRLSREQQGWRDRPNLMLAAAVAMRRALVDHVRRRRAQKRGGGKRATDDLDQLEVHDRRFDVLDLEDALRQLEGEDGEAAQVAELRVFGGLTVPECAEALDVSTRTIERRWRFARAWLVSELGGSQA